MKVLVRTSEDMKGFKTWHLKLFTIKDSIIRLLKTSWPVMTREPASH